MRPDMLIASFYFSTTILLTALNFPVLSKPSAVNRQQ
jgi:hypothetical protein